MTHTPSILLPLDGTEQAAKSVGCAAFLARGYGGALHISSAIPGGASAQKELERLHVPAAYWPLVELHHIPRYSDQEILAAVERYRAGLLILPAQPSAKAWPGPESGDSALDHAVGQVAESVLERSTVPVLLIPPEYREALPWQSVLVAVSGGRESEGALAFAIELAQTFELGLNVVHVVDGGREGLAARMRYSDASHHEFPAQLDELLERRLLACCCPHRLEQLTLGHGEASTELVKLVHIDRPSVLVAGWHGTLSPGRAVRLKKIVVSVQTPIALIKTVDLPRFRLKVGEDFEDSTR